MLTARCSSGSLSLCSLRSCSPLRSTNILTSIWVTSTSSIIFLHFLCSAFCFSDQCSFFVNNLSNYFIILCCINLVFLILLFFWLFFFLLMRIIILCFRVSGLKSLLLSSDLVEEGIRWLPSTRVLIIVSIHLLSSEGRLVLLTERASQTLLLWIKAGRRRSSDRS